MRRYALVGTGGRSWIYIEALTGPHSDEGMLVGLCDKNQGRARLRQTEVMAATGSKVPTFSATQFEKMIAEQHPDEIIVTTGPDRTHSEYIIRAMEAGCDVISEKPMTIDAGKCRAILEARARTGRRLRVTFNYRYSPPRRQVKRIILEGAIGEVLSAKFSWHLDTKHGADYFRRWHRERANSGSLLVHKATHHFDLVNWWLDDVPEEVFAHGSRRYYTPQRADEMGLTDRGERCTGCAAASRCPFFMNMDENEDMVNLYRNNEHLDGYFRDRCVFGDEVDIWDTMSLTVKYRKGAILSYLLHAYSPVEGYRIDFNGTKGRLEHVANEASYVSGDGSIPGELESGRVSTTLIPEFEKPRSVEVESGEGGHGGGDPAMLQDLFGSEIRPDPLGQRATHVDGTFSILIGVAAAASIESGETVKIGDLIGDTPLG